MGLKSLIKVKFKFSLIYLKRFLIYCTAFETNIFSVSCPVVQPILHRWLHNRKIPE